jgi:hypothetical protein
MRSVNHIVSKYICYTHNTNMRQVTLLSMSDKNVSCMLTAEKEIRPEPLKNQIFPARMYTQKYT